jgi:Tol biopolymer transport system component
MDTISAILKEDPADFPSDVHAASPAIERIVRRCLEKNVEERFQSARDVTFAFEAISSATGVRSAVADVGRATARGRRWMLPLVGAAAALAIVAAAAYIVGTRIGSRQANPPVVTQLTFRKGTVRGARFSPDGHTVYYAASWEADPITAFATRLGSPESSPVPVPPGDILAISSTGELALSVNARTSAPFLTLGTLARGSMSGGAPRELLESVNSADFIPGGSDLVAIRTVPGRGSSLQFPIGTERLNTPYWLSDARVSADGSQVAFIAHPLGGDEGEVRIVGRTGEARTISKGWISIQGLHWSPNGQELWFTGTRAGMLRALWAVSLEGHERLLYRAPLRLQLEDVAPDGRVLVTGMNVEGQVRFGSFAEKIDRSLSWFDWATSASLSADARQIAYTESGEGAGSTYGVFVRPTDGGPAARVADGSMSALSPDGRLVGVLNANGTSMTIVPTGAGTTRTIDVSKLAGIQSIGWYPDNQHMTITGTEAGHQQRTYSLDIAAGRYTPITPEGTVGRFVSPNGEWIMAANAASRGVFNLRTGTLTPLQGAMPAERPAGWSADGSAVFVYLPEQRGVHIYQLIVSSGARSLVTTIEAGDPAGVIAVGNVIVAADGVHYAYNVFRQLSQLFMIDLGK